jgi:septal ring factor EnvC (AmiA/AmiB activator)
MSKDLKAISAVYIITILSMWLLLNNVQTKKEIAKHKAEILEVKKVAVQLDERLTRFEDMVDSLNVALDVSYSEKEALLQEYSHLETLKKDLR